MHEPGADEGTGCAPNEIRCMLFRSVSVQHFKAALPLCSEGREEAALFRGVAH